MAKHLPIPLRASSALRGRTRGIPCCLLTDRINPRPGSAGNIGDRCHGLRSLLDLLNFFSGLHQFISKDRQYSSQKKTSLVNLVIYWKYSESKYLYIIYFTIFTIYIIIKSSESTYFSGNLISKSLVTTRQLAFGDAVGPWNRTEGGKTTLDSCKNLLTMGFIGKIIGI